MNIQTIKIPKNNVQAETFIVCQPSSLLTGTVVQFSQQTTINTKMTKIKKKNKANPNKIDKTIKVVMAIS